MQINRLELLSAIKLVSKAVPSRPMIPVLQGILFQVSEKLLILSGFDINNGVQVSLPIDNPPGKSTFLVSARIIQSVLAKFTSSTIDLDIQSESVVISNDTATAEIQMMPDALDYPVQCFDISDATPQSIDRSIIEAMLSVLFATSGEESKHILQAVNIATANGTITFAATDGHRLATTTIASELVIEPISLGNSGLELLSGFKFTDAPINIYRVDGGIIFSHDGTLFLVREIDGKYPDYQLLMPKDFKIGATVDRHELISAIELAQISGDNTKVVKLNIDSILTISSASEIAKSSSTIQVESNGKSILFAMNSDYLLAAVRQVDAAKITFDINTPLTPIVIQWQQKEFQKIILLMPVQIRE